MKLPRYVKTQPALLRYLPTFKNSGGNNVFPFIFLRKDLYNDLLTDKPQPKSIAALLHEETHRQRQISSGWFLWSLKYVLFPSFRFMEELEAYKATMSVLKKNKVPFDTEKVSKHLSGPLYLWSTSYARAKLSLEKAWNET